MVGFGETHGEGFKGRCSGLRRRHPRALTDVVSRDVPKGSAFEKSHPPSMKKNKKENTTEKNHQQQQKPPTPTFSFMRARNTTKLRGRRQLLSAFVPRSTRSHEPAARPAPLLSQPSWLGLGAGGTPWAHPPWQRGALGSPKEIFARQCGSQGFTLPGCVQTCPNPDLCLDLRNLTRRGDARSRLRDLRA